MSYGADIFENYRLAGVYTGRALKGKNLAELPVLQRWVYDDGGVPMKSRLPTSMPHCRTISQALVV